LGLAFAEKFVFGTKSLFENLVAEGNVKVPQFSLKLTANDSGIYWGGAYPSSFTGEFTTMNVTLPVRSCVQGAKILLLMIYSGRVSGK
jgi:hypothetical protein